MDIADLRREIGAASSSDLADELVAAYEEMRSRYFRRDFRPSELEGGRFAEAAFRILQLKATGRFSPVGRALDDLPTLMQTLQDADPNTVHESIRVHMPRALAAVYNVRNRRDVGHIAADVDANAMDAEFVVATCSWVLAEFVRLFHGCEPEVAREYVEEISRRRTPLVQLFGNEPFVLTTELTPREEIELLIYHRGNNGVSLDDLDRWTPTITRSVLSARLSDLERRDRYIRRVDGLAYLTDTGAQHIEARLSDMPGR